MAATVDRLAQDRFRERVEEALAEPDPRARAHTLRHVVDELDGLREWAAEHLEEAVEEESESVWRLAFRQVRENADMRESLIERGMATAERCDALGLVSHEALDEAAEAGELHEAAFGALGKLGNVGGGGGLVKFLERLHPRDRGGKFARKPGSAKLEALVGRDGKREPGGAGTAKSQVKRTPAGGKGKGEKGFKTPDVKPHELAVQDQQGLGPGERPAGMSRRQASQERKRTREVGRKKTGGVQTPGQVEAATAKDREKRRAEMAKRVGKEVAKAGPEAERAKAGTKPEGAGEVGGVDFNEAGSVSQKSLLGYVRNTLTTPSTADAHSEMRGDKRVYHPDRRQLHDAIIDVLLRQPNEDGSLSASNGYLPSQETPDVLFMGGGYAAGKSSTQKILAARGDQPPDALVLNPDQVKSMLPEFAATSSHDPEANLRVYEEAWDIAQELQRQAQERKINMIVDGITNTSADEVLGRVQGFRDAGYGNARIAYVDIPTDEALGRSAQRAERATERGDGANMRHTPEPILRAVHRDVAATVPALMSDPRTKELGVNIEAWDNSGEGAPVRMANLDAGGELQVEDRESWQRFQNKAHEKLGAVGETGPTLPEDIVAKLDDAQANGLNDWPVVSDAPVPGGASSGELFKALTDRGLSGQDLGTHNLHGDGKGGFTKQRRLEVHNSVIKDAFTGKDGTPLAEFVTDSDGIITGVKPLVETDDPPRMLFMMGGSASGKSSALALAGEEVEPPNAVTLDPDHVKGQLPEYEQMMGERETKTLPNGKTIQVPKAPDKFAAAGVHEESSMLTKTIQQMAQGAGLNVVVDGTGDNNPAKGDQPSKFASKILKAKQEGYDVDVFGVNAPTNVAVIDATNRARDTGRWVPEPEIRKIHRNVSANLPEIRALVEDGTISNAQFWDRSGGDMKKIMSFNPNTQEFELLDPVAWDAMLAKAQETPTSEAGAAAARQAAGRA